MRHYFRIITIKRAIFGILFSVGFNQASRGHFYSHARASVSRGGTRGTEASASTYLSPEPPRFEPQSGPHAFQRPDNDEMDVFQSRGACASPRVLACIATGIRSARELISASAWPEANNGLLLHSCASFSGMIGNAWSFSRDLYFLSPSAVA